MTKSQTRDLKLSWWELLNPLQIATHLYRQHDLIRQMTRREISQRYRGSLLGLAWSLIVPLTSLAIYTFVFSGIFQSNWRPGASASTGEYALTLFAGLTAFNLFSEMMGRAPLLILAVPNLVKKVLFPLEILPLVQIGASLLTSIFSIGVLVLAGILFTQSISTTLWMLPLAFVPLLFLTLGVGWFLSALGVYVRDISQGIGIVTQILLFLSPVMYPTSAVPENLRSVFYINPLTTVLDGFRATLLWGQPLDWPNWGLWVVVSFVWAVLAYAWFMKMKPGFADVM